MGIKKLYQRTVAPRYDAKPSKKEVATRVRGYVPLATPAWLSTAVTNVTETVACKSVVSTSAIAVVVKIRAQDTVTTSFAEVRPKASVQTGQRSKVRLWTSPASSLVETQAIIPVNTDRQILFQRSGGLQTASLAVVGYYL